MSPSRATVAKEAINASAEALTRAVRVDLAALRESVMKYNETRDVRSRMTMRQALESALEHRHPELARELAKFSSVIDSSFPAPRPRPAKTKNSKSRYTKRVDRNGRPGQITQHATAEDRWRVRVFVGRDGAGKKTYKSATVHGTLADAEAMLRDMLRHKSAGRYEAKGDMALAEYIDEVWAPEVEPTVAPRTMKWYRHILDRHVVPRIGHRSMSSLNEATARRLAASLRGSGVGGRALESAVMMTNRLVRRASERGHIALAISGRHSPERIRQLDP